MAAVQFDNYYQTELTAAVAPTDLTIEVMSVSSSILAHITGGNWIYLTLVDANSFNNNLIPPATREIVKVTAITGTGPYTLTVVRAADQNPPMTAQSFSRCDIAAFLLNAQSLYDIGGGGGGATGATGPTGATGATGATGSGGGGSVSITATTPIVVAPSPITGTGVVSHAATAVTPSTYGDSTHVAQFTVNQTGHLTFAGNVALSAGGTLQSQEFLTNGTFNVPAGVSGVWVTGIGAGAGGGTRAAALGGGGGGAGEYGQMLPLSVTPSGTLSITVGVKGAGAAAGGGAANGADGTSSVVGPYTFLGGLGGHGASNGTGGTGGGANGGAGGVSTVGPGTAGTIESASYFGGGGGGGGSTTTGGAGSGGCPGPGHLTGAAGGSTASTQGGGGGGATSLYGLGGVGGNGGVGGTNATSGSPTSGGAPGSGGGGAGGLTGNNAVGGNGADGYVLIMWVA